MCISSRDNHKHVRQRNRWGIPSWYRSAFRKVSEGDRCVLYLTSERGPNPGEIRSLFEVVEEPKEVKTWRDSNIFDRKYHLQVTIWFDKELEEGIPIERFVHCLPLIRNPKHCGAYLCGYPMRELTRDDFGLLKELIVAQ
ncbi:MAG: EVE domain-containing protein [Thermoplasmata archaeon]